MALRARLTSWRPEWPADFPGVLPDRSSTRIGSENSRRNTQRTASTAAALMIGIALVTFVAVLGQGLRSTFENAVNDQFVADYALTSQNGFDPITIEAETAAKRAPNAVEVSGVRAGDGRAFGKTIQVSGVEPNLSRVIKEDWAAGSASVPAQLGTNGAFVEKDYAKHHDLTLGSPIRLETPSGRILDLRLKGIFDAPQGGSPFGSITMSAKRFDAEYPAPKNLFAFINTRGGVNAENTSQLELALNAYPDAKIQTQTQFKDNQEKPLNMILNLLYVLLALSVIVSLFGIVNTLVLTVFERTRELGMLRAIGMTRRQVRRMIRHESVVTALIGAALGIVVGLFLAALVTKAFESDGLAFAIPVVTIVIFALAALVAGILSAIFPARRAARLNVLEALQYE
jgi:putative ABC transport system permease protein